MNYFQPDPADPIERERQHGFLPPQYVLYRLPADSADGWSGVPPVAALTDMRGARIAAGCAAIRLACADDSLLLCATGTDVPFSRPELPPDSPEFWRQDHIEFRFLPDPTDPERQVQFIVAPDGRFWDNQGWWKTPEAHGIACRAEITAAGWTVVLRLPVAAVTARSRGASAGSNTGVQPSGVTPAANSGAFRGIVAHTRWHGDAPDYACSAPTELGFPHAARFGEFCLADSAPPVVTLLRVTAAGAELYCHSATPQSVRLGVVMERAEFADVPGSGGEPCVGRSPTVAGASRSRQPDRDGLATFAFVRRLVSGVNRIRLRLPLDPLRFTRVAIEIKGPDSALTRLGAATLRAPLPPVRIPQARLRHPYLRFDAAGLAAIRAKSATLPFSRYLADVALTDADLTGAELPDPDAPVSLDITPDCMNWFRVARETMLRDGAGDRNPAARRLWELQSPAAQAAWHGVVKAVTPTPELLAVLIPELNALLRRPDLYDATAFRHVRLPAEAKALLAGPASASGVCGDAPAPREATGDCRRAPGAGAAPYTPEPTRQRSGVCGDAPAPREATGDCRRAPGAGALPYTPEPTRQRSGVCGDAPAPREAFALPPNALIRFNRILLQSTIECMSNYRMDLVTLPGQYFEKWLATGDARLIATATRAVQAALRLTILGHEIHLHEGMAAGGMALAYDAFHPHLTPAARGAWQELLARFLHLHLETCHRRSWTVTTIANANPVGNGGCGLAALALWRERPALAREALDFAREYLWAWLDYGNGADGGNTEGAQYWQYGAENFLRFAVAFERVTGGDDGMLTHPAVRHWLDMVRVGLCNDGALHGVNDTVPTPIGGALAWFAAQRFGEEFGLWYGDHARRWFAVRRAAGKPIPYCAGVTDALLYRPAAPEVFTQPPLPHALCIESIQYATVRSGTEFACRWVAGLKGSRPPYTHHNQPDTGSFFADLRGERLLIDPGYYKDKPEHHCLPLIGGRGPVTPGTWTGSIIECRERGDCRYLACDSTPAYGGAAERVVRHLVLVGDEALIILDDIVAAGASVTAQYQCGGPTQELPGAPGWLVRGEHAVVRAAVAGPAGLALASQPERSLQDTHWGYHFADCRWFPVTTTYAPIATTPLVTVFQDATDAVPPPAQVEYAPGRAVVRLPSGRTLSFRVTANGAWAAEMVGDP